MFKIFKTKERMKGNPYESGYLNFPPCSMGDTDCCKDARDSETKVEDILPSIQHFSDFLLERGLITQAELTLAKKGDLAISIKQYLPQRDLGT
jgi:hypothetical protein